MAALDLGAMDASIWAVIVSGGVSLLSLVGGGIGWLAASRRSAAAEKRALAAEARAEKQHDWAIHKEVTEQTIGRLKAEIELLTENRDKELSARLAADNSADSISYGLVAGWFQAWNAETLPLIPMFWSSIAKVAKRDHNEFADTVNKAINMEQDEWIKQYSNDDAVNAAMVATTLLQVSGVFISKMLKATTFTHKFRTAKRTNKNLTARQFYEIWRNDAWDPPLKVEFDEIIDMPMDLYASIERFHARFNRPIPEAQEKGAVVQP